MKRRRGLRLAWSLLAVSVAFVVAAAVLFALTHSTHVEGKNPLVDLLIAVVLLVFPTVGALVASRLPGNAIGWLFLGVGVAFAIAELAQEYAIEAIFARPGSLRGGVIAAWLSDWIGYPAIALGCSLVLLLFPQGRLLSGRWRAAAWLAVTAAVLLSAGSALVPGSLQEFTSLQNPVGIIGAKGPLDVVQGLGWVLTLVSILISAVSVVVRFRRTRGEEREQLKWIAAAAALLVLFWLTAASAPVSSQVGDALFLVGLAAFPVSVGFAILKYRLYEIDVIIRRTLVYAVLSALLAGLYFGIVLALQAAFNSFTQGNELAVAGSTLAVAALFRPARRRIQALVDRRFYRSKVDAARTLEAFSARLRREIDLDTLAAELRSAAQETMQPAHLSLWVRSPEARP